MIKIPNIKIDYYFLGHEIDDFVEHVSVVSFHSRDISNEILGESTFRNTLHRQVRYSLWAYFMFNNCLYVRISKKVLG